MAITVGTSTSTAAATTTSLTLVIDAGVATNDILVLALVNRDATAAPTVSDNDIGGNSWTLLRSQSATTNGSIHIYWKRATSGTAGKTITASGFTGSCAGGVTPFTGASLEPFPFGASAVAGEANASANETQAAISVSHPGSMVFLVVGNTSNDTLNVTTQAATDPSSLTERFEGTSTGGNDCSISLSSAVKTTAGSTGAFTWAQTDGTGASLAFALDPAVSTSQTAYRYYEDGTESGSSAIAAQNTNITRDVSSDSNLQLRVRLQDTSAVSRLSTDDYQLQYELNDSGTYYTVGSDATPTLLDSYSEANADSEFLMGNSVTTVAQSITGNGGVLDSVKFYIRQGTSLAGTGALVVTVHAHTGTYGTSSAPTGVALATSTRIDITKIPVSNQLVTFSFVGSNRITLTNGTNYVLALNFGEGTTRLAVRYDASSPTHGGNAYNDSLGAISSADLCFYLYTGSPQVLGYNSASLTDAAATTNRLGAGTGSFVAGEISESGLVTDHAITASNYTEYLYSLTLVSAELANNDTIDFRVLKNGLSTELTYTVTPRITVSKTAPSSFNAYPMLHQMLSIGGLT